MNGSGKDSFVIEDLDDHHLAIKPDTEYVVRKELETEVSYQRLLFVTISHSDCLFFIVGKEHL